MRCLRRACEQELCPAQFPTPPPPAPADPYRPVGTFMLANQRVIEQLSVLHQKRMATGIKSYFDVQFI